MKKKRLVPVKPARPIPVIATEDRAFAAIRDIYHQRRRRAARWQRVRFVVEWAAVALLLLVGAWWLFRDALPALPSTTLPAWEDLTDGTH